MKAALIKTDKDTLTKLKVIAGEKSLSAFMRDLANGIEQTPVPVNELETLRASILGQLEGIKAKLDSFDKYLSYAETNIQHLTDLQAIQVQALMDIPGGKKAFDAKMKEYWQHRQAPIEEEGPEVPTDLTDIENWKKGYKGD